MRLSTAIALLTLSLTSVSTPVSAALRGGGKGNGNGNGKTDVDEVATGTPPTAIEDHPAPDIDEVDVDVEADTRATADMLGLSLDDAKVLMKQQEEFSELVAEMETDNLFLQAEMPSVPNGEFKALYKNGNVPPARQKQIDKFKSNNKQATVKTVASKLSFKDAQGRGDRLTAKLEKKSFTNVSYSIDGDSIELLAKMTKDMDKKGKGKVPPGQAKEILELSDDDPDADELTLVLTEFDEEDPTTPLHTYGGRKISGGGYQCTTAFSVVHSSGATGVATAAHCQGMNWYDAIGEADYRTYWQKQEAGTYGDVEWHRTYHVDKPEYYARPTTRWPVRSIAGSISKGQVVCGYSRMQGTRDCDTVHKTSVSVQYSGWPRMSNLVAMKGRMMIGGDSGGPWSYYDKAFGVVSGAMVICDSSFLWMEWDCYWRDIWSRASLMGPALGVQVLTQ